MILTKGSSKSRKITCLIELKVWDSAGYDPRKERKIRDTLVEKGSTSSIIYLARGGNEGWEYFKSKFTVSTRAMSLVTRISP